MKYKKRAGQTITAVQIKLDMPGFSYRKWGGLQQAKTNDWLVDNDGEIYTVDAVSFAATYLAVSPGRYVKTSSVWAKQAKTAGVIATREGSSEYDKGDYLVSNNELGTDEYCVNQEKFESMYEVE